MPLTSMTGFASLAGEADGFSWAWEVRSVNGRSLDLRLRLPEGFESLEPILRGSAARSLTRGTVSITLRHSLDAALGQLRVNRAALEAAVESVQVAERSASASGLELVRSCATDLLAMRGVMETDTAAASENPGVMAMIGEQIPQLFSALVSVRAAEGKLLRRAIEERIDGIEGLTALAHGAAEARSARRGELLRARVMAILETSGYQLDPARLAQELALIAVKADVSEEIDRLSTHVVSARALLGEAGPVGRKLDFLAQEFNREANTLCSKAQSPELTAIGLDMKVVIDQMREQVQNVE